MNRNIINDNNREILRKQFNTGTIMRVNDLTCGFNMPEALETSVIINLDEQVKTEVIESLSSLEMKFNKVYLSQVTGTIPCKNLDKVNKIEGVKEVNEGKHSLPPYAQRKAFVVDEYLACPVNWMNGSDIASSYFVPIKADHGMWLDFNRCRTHKHDVAIVISVQGINSITGLKTDVLNLEQYKQKCPKHNVDFQQDRFCPECKYKWPGQNYLSTTGQPFGQLWLDGFRAPDGVVRQYVFTEDEARGVAKAIIGNDRVFAVGIGFYLSKQPKPLPASQQDMRGGGYLGLADNSESLMQFAAGSGDLYKTKTCTVPDHTASYNTSPGATSHKDIATFKRISIPLKPTRAINYEVAAGSLIDQEIYLDPNNLDYWEEAPAGMIYINYCDEETALNIIQAGVREEHKDGFLNNIPVGN